MSFFSSIKQYSTDPIVEVHLDFLADSREHKVSLGLGSYNDENGTPYVLPVVRKAEQLILDQKLNKEYLFMTGSPELVKVSTDLIFGEESDRICGAQTVGSSAALRIGGELLKESGTNTIYVSDPTWSNHIHTFSKAGLQVIKYPYYNKETHGLDFHRLLEFIETLPPGSSILLHPSCHNPTGIDPTQDEWITISQAIKKRKLIPFFDMAYQGFGKGIEEDAFAIRQFYHDGHEMLVAHSYSKNFGLYGERVGTLSIVTEDHNTTKKVTPALIQIIRGLYSAPPLQGSRIVSTIYNQPELKEEWKNELQTMRTRISKMRQALVSALPELDYIKDQNGMFSYSGLSEQQVDRLKKEFGIYALKSGRINVAGLNENNLEYVINAIRHVM